MLHKKEKYCRLTSKEREKISYNLAKGIGIKRLLWRLLEHRLQSPEKYHKDTTMNIYHEAIHQYIIMYLS